MKKTYNNVEDYLKTYFNARKDFIHKKEEEAGVPLTSLNKFIRRVKTRAAETNYKDLDEITIEEAKESARKLLNTNLYTTYAERAHKNVTSMLKEEGIMSKIYRMGGKTSMASSRFVASNYFRDISGASYKANGAYYMGTVKVIFWVPTNYNNPQFIEVQDMMGKSDLRIRKKEI